MNGGDVGGWVTVSLFGLLAMSDEVFEGLYCRHGGGLIYGRYEGLVILLPRKGPLPPGQSLKEWRKVEREDGCWRLNW